MRIIKELVHTFEKIKTSASENKKKYIKELKKIC